MNNKYKKHVVNYVFVCVIYVFFFISKSFNPHFPFSQDDVTPCAYEIFVLASVLYPYPKLCHVRGTPVLL